jgi:hypothetical protein
MPKPQAVEHRKQPKPDATGALNQGKTAGRSSSFSTK